MLMICLAQSSTLQHDRARYSAGYSPKLDPKFDVAASVQFGEWCFDQERLPNLGRAAGLAADGNVLRVAATTVFLYSVTGQSFP